MKKIIIVSEMLTGYGGMESVISKTVKLLIENFGVETKVFLYGRTDSSNFEWLNGINFITYRTDVRNRKLQHFLSAWKLSRYIRKQRPDILIAANAIPCYISRLAVTLSRRKVALLSWAHLSLGYRKDRYLLADGHLAICNEIKRQLEDLGANKDHISVVYNPITPTDKTIHRPSGTTKFVYIGRVIFEGQKYLKDLFDACSKLNGSWELHVLGDGDDVETCKQYTQSINISDKVTWHGWQRTPWSYISDNLKEVSSLVLCSAYEGFGLVLAEALSHGIFCISSDCVCGPSDIVKHGDNGILYTPHDVVALCAAMQAVINKQEMPSHEHLKQSVAKFHDLTFIQNFWQEVERLQAISMTH